MVIPSAMISCWLLGCKIIWKPSKNYMKLYINSNTVCLCCCLLLEVLGALFTSNQTLRHSALYSWMDFFLLIAASHASGQSVSWGDLVDQSEGRSPGRAVQMHQKLSSPSRKKYVDADNHATLHGPVVQSSSSPNPGSGWCLTASWFLNVRRILQQNRCVLLCIFHVIA